MSKVTNNFAGLNGFIWWTGVVENRMDPLKLGRCQVRIFGWHTENLQLIPSSELPWALPSIPTNTAQINKTPKEGDYVFGFFFDSESGQFPCIMGIIPGIPVEEPKQGSGFYDQRTDAEVNSSPAPYGTSPSLYPNRLDEPTTSRLYRNEKIDTTIIAREKSLVVTGIPTSTGDSWSQPEPSYAAVTPYNQVMETESGHVMEFDDTKGAERVHIAHRTGTYTEVQADGSKITRVVFDNYEIIAGTNYVNVIGDCNITVNGNANLYVKGNVVEKVDGNINSTVSGQVTATASAFNFNGNINVSGSITASGDVVGGGISLDKHVHGGVQNGGSVTSVPQ
jgi:phage baseplate assembly protein gpV